LGTDGYPLRRRKADVICGVLVISDVWGDRAPSVDIGPALGRGVIVVDRLLLGAIDARGEAF